MTDTDVYYTTRAVTVKWLQDGASYEAKLETLPMLGAVRLMTALGREGIATNITAWRGAERLRLRYDGDKVTTR